MEDIQGKLIHIPKTVLEDLNVIAANHKGKAKGYIEDLVVADVKRKKEFGV